MKTFTRIVDAGSISRAAEQMSVAKSQVSRRLTDLEARLDVQLLKRTTRKSSLTEAGQSYYQRALQILADVTELNTVTSCAKINLKGDLKITVPLTFGLQHLVPVIHKFADLHPGLVIHLDFSDHQVNLIEDGFDLAVRIADLKESSYIARKLAPIRTILCASPSYLDKRGYPQTLEDLKTHDILHYTKNSKTGWLIKTPDGENISVRLPAKMSANSGDFLKKSAIAGHGIARLPTFMVNQDLKDAHLVTVMTDYTLPTLHAYTVYPQTRYLSRRVTAFIDFLADHFTGEPYWDKYI